MVLIYHTNTLEISITPAHIHRHPLSCTNSFFIPPSHHTMENPTYSPPPLPDPSSMPTLINFFHSINNGKNNPHNNDDRHDSVADFARPPTRQCFVAAASDMTIIALWSLCLTSSSVVILFNWSRNQCCVGTRSICWCWMLWKCCRIMDASHFFAGLGVLWGHLFFVDFV